MPWTAGSSSYSQLWLHSDALQRNYNRLHDTMLASREHEMGWGSWFLIFCMVLVLGPGSHANYSGGYHDPERGAVVGMDLGSETLRAGIIRDGKFEVLSQMPSCIAFTDQWPLILMGEEAKAQRSNNSARTICDPKSLIGQRWSDPKFQKTIPDLHYRVVQGKEDMAVITMNIRGQQREFYPSLLTGLLLSRLRFEARDKLGEKVGYAVVAVPGHFTDYQRRVLKSAADRVTLEILRIVNDYGAAGIAYEIDRTEVDANFIVMDLGASKTEITAIFVEEGVMEPLATVSEPTISLYNRRLVKHIAAQCATEGTLLDQQAQIELEESIELTQRNRSFVPSAYCLRTDSLKHCSGLPICPMDDSTQDSMMSMSATILEPLKRVLHGLNMTIEWEESRPFLKKDIPYIPSNISNVTSVLAVGGFSKSPMVTWLLEALRRNESWIDRDFDPEEAVLKGAAIQAAVLSNTDDNMVSYVDVTPISLGLETSQGYIHKFTRRYTPIPTRKAQNLTTAYDNQESMLIRVFEGDRMMARDNLLLGKLELTGIPRAPRHVPIVEVSFELDANSILKVKARCLNTTIEASATFEDTSLYITDPGNAQRFGTEVDRQFEESTIVTKASMERYVEMVERGIAREDVIYAADTVDEFNLKREANKIVQETRKWLATQSDIAPDIEFKRRKSELWDVMHDLLHYNPPGRIYSVGSQDIVESGHDEL